jgi:outer membrane protein
MKSFLPLCLRTVLVSVVSLGMTYHAAVAQSPTAQTGEPSISAPVRVLTLEECIKIAVGDNLDVQNSLARVLGSASDVKAAQGLYLPTASGSVSYGRSIPLSATQTSFVGGIPITQPISEAQLNVFGASVNVNYNVFDFFQRENTVSRVNSTYEAVNKNVIVVRQRALFNIRAQYLSVLRAKQVVNIRREDLEVGKKQLERIRAQREAGVVAIAAVYAQEADLGTRELNLAQAENDMETAKGTLLTTLGMNPGLVIDVNEKGFSTDIRPEDVTTFRQAYSNYKNVYDQALDKRADRSAAQLTVKASEHGLASSQAAFLPTIGLGAGWNWQNNSIGDFDRSRPFIGARVDFNIFDAFQREQNVQNSQMQVTMNQVQLRQAEQRIAGDVQNAFIQLNASEKNLDITARALKASQQNFEAAEERFKVGAANILDLTTANANLATSKINRITALYNYIGAQYQMKFALGLLDE